MTREQTFAVFDDLADRLGRIPKVSELAEALHGTPEDARIILRELFTVGRIARAGNRYVRIRPEPKAEETPPKTDAGPLARLPVKIGYPVGFLLFRLAMAILGLGAAAVSAYYTAAWFEEFLPAFGAWFLAAIVVGFALVAFEVVVYFARKRGPFLILSAVFAVLWLIVVVFSIGSTVAGQFNARAAIFAPAAASADDTEARIAAAEARRDRAAGALAAEDRLVSSVPDIRTAALYRTALAESEARRSRAEAERAAAEAELLAFRSAKTEAASRPVGAFYTWLAGILGTTAGVVEFLMSLFPAIFVDIIAPAAVAIALFARPGAYNRPEEKK